jgi:hypothetical protein
MALIGTPTAMAATEAGDECVGNLAGGPYTLIPEAHASGGALPLSAPAGGVVTEWKVNSGLAATVPEFMAAFRPTGQVGTFEVIGESNQEDVKQGLNVFPTRIPVHAGDRFGPVPVGDESPVYCSTGNSGDAAWSFPGSVGVGSIHTYAAGIKTRVPLIAVIEPDRDGDGYGDETQDGCPQSAAYHGPCPTITLDAFPIVLKRSVLILVSASETSSVQVFGQVGWKARHKGGALASKTPNPGGDKSVGVIVGLTGGSETVQPGEVASFNVKLPKSVKRQLAQTPRGKSLKGTITAQTTDLAGRVAEHTITIRLPGQGLRHP